MRRILSALFGFTAVAALTGLAVLGAPDRVTHASDLAQRIGDSPCIPTYQKFAEPSVILLGETVDLTIRAAAVCAGETYPLHIVMVLDASGSMAGSKNQEMKNAAKNMITRLKMEDNPGTQVGVVQFHTTARTLCELTNQSGRAIGCVNQVPAAGGTQIDLGIEEGMKVLRRGRNRATDRENIREVMIVLSDGGNNTGCPPVLMAAGSAKGQGVLLITICVGSDCDVSCMRQAATSGRYFFEARNAGGLSQIFERIRDDIVNINLKRLTITDILPANMTYLPDAADENAPDWNENTRLLEWEESYVPKEGMTYTIRVEPQQVGYWPTNVEARGIFVDNKNRSGEFVYEVPYVTVLNPGILATPETPPVPPTFTPIPPPTVTPTPRPRPIYLPVNLHQRCTIIEEHVDIVLVLDVSTSMSTLTQNGRPKMDAILDASKAFAGTIDLTPNELDQFSQVGIAGFNNSAWVELPLSNDLNAIYAGLDRLPQRMAEFTRLDLGVQVGGHAAVGENHKPANKPVVVFLTDGLPNQVPYAEDGTMETTVLRMADAAKQQGVVFYTIGVGIPDSPEHAQRINPVLLTEIAGDAERYFEAADAEGVRAIYEELKIVRNCERQRWGRVNPIP